MARMARQLNNQRKKRTSVLRSQTESGTWSAISSHCGWKLNFAAASRNKRFRQRVRLGSWRINQLRELAAILAQRRQNLSRRHTLLGHANRAGRGLNVEKGGDHPQGAHAGQMPSAWKQQFAPKILKDGSH